MSYNEWYKFYFKQCNTEINIENPLYIHQGKTFPVIFEIIDKHY